MKKAERSDKIMSIFFTVITGAVFLFILSFFLYIFWNGRKGLSLSFLFNPNSSGIDANGNDVPIGIGTQLFNSLYMVFLSMLLTIPIGLGAGIYLAEYAKEGRLKRIIRLCIETLASVPSIVIGLFGFLVFAQFLHLGYSILSGALALSILNIPLMTRVSEDAIKNVDQSIKQGSLALGATRFQTIMKSMIPASLSGIITGALLATGRAFGEAAALIYTAGMSSSPVNFTHTFGSDSPFSLFRSAETLSVFIWKVNSESLIENPGEIANAASAVLLTMVLIFNVSARFIESRLRRKYSGE